MKDVIFRTIDRLLVISLQGIGNNIFIVPMLTELRKNYPELRIDLLVLNRSIPKVLDKPGLVNNYLFLGAPKFSNAWNAFLVVMKLRTRKYPLSLLVFPSNNIFFNVISFLIGAKVRLVHKYPAHARQFGFLNNRFIPLAKVHDIYQNLNLIGITDWDPDRPDRIFYCLDSVLRKQIDSKYGLTKKGFHVGIHPGSSSERAMREKRWAPRNFNSVISWMLGQRTDLRVFIFLGPDELDLKEKIDMSDERVVLVQEKDLSGIIHLISKMNYFIANDSGLMNMAVALRVPTLNIAGGPTDPVRTFPLGVGNAILFSTIPCYPCRGLDNIGKKFKCIFPTRRCLEEITTKQVIEMIRVMWG